ncbi:carboxypeptidase-like protein S1 [Halenospora varia]|nr:carboxypeptidase-like protein S1 [Halenospora varia]
MRFQFCNVVLALALPFFGAAMPTESPAGEELPAHMRGKRSYVVRDGVKRTVFQHEATGATLDYVTNSGICETTPGVNQYSGYISVGSNQNMWFWFFEARNNASTAPLAMWLNGGPGCSSMIGLFQENGPCQFYNGASTPSLNKYSWNEYANMLYIDQPIGTGFSYGTDPVTSTVTAAPYVWAFMQAFYAQYPQYQNKDFGIFTESYGGHYGPEFANYFQTQNSAIKAGTVTGQPINLVALGINNGWIDPTINYKSFIDYSYNNTYNQILTTAQYNSFTSTYTSSCLPALKKCTTTTSSNAACSSAATTCGNKIENAIINSGNFDPYDVRQPYADPYPPVTYSSYISSAAVVKAIGAKSTYSECSDAAGNQFYSTGDTARTFLPTLSSVVQSGIQVLMWAGDADWICNWVGNFATAELVSYSQAAAFKAKAVANYTVNGVAAGTYKTAGNLSWLRVFGAGHEVPYYQPEVALQAFKQTMQKGAIFAT